MRAYGANVLFAAVVLTTLKVCIGSQTTLVSMVARMRGHYYPSEHAMYVLLQDALDRGRHSASTFKLLAKAAVGTAIAEIAIFASTGSTSGVVREVLFGAIMALYLYKPRSRDGL